LQESKRQELIIRRVSPYRRQKVLETYEKELREKLLLNKKSLTATVEFLDYSIQKSEQYKMEAENLTSSIKDFKTLLETDRKNFEDDSHLLAKVETMVGENMKKLVIKVPLFPTLSCILISSNKLQSRPEIKILHPILPKFSRPM
jgi:hypothetical protein